MTPLKFVQNGVEIVDTPGLDDPVIQREEITKSYLLECDLMIHLMNVNQSATQKDIEFIKEPTDAKSNYWLQAVILKDKKTRDDFLDFTNKNGVMSRPIWKLMNELDMFKGAQCSDLKNSKFLEQRVVNISSSVVV